MSTLLPQLLCHLPPITTPPSLPFNSRLIILLSLFVIGQCLFALALPTNTAARLSPPLPPPEPLSSSTKNNRRNEMLVPLNSTTALICDPVFNQGRAEAEARWMRNGLELARVNGNSNAVIGTNRDGKRNIVDSAAPSPNPSHRYHPQQQQQPQADAIPEIGFLVIKQTRPEDEGDYWCERIQDGQQGERTRLRVAFLDQFGAGTRPVLATPVDRGQLVVLNCVPPAGVPKPIISWHFNGERVTDFSALNAQIVANGSLLIHNYSAHQSGFYACEAVNFVGRTLTEQIFLALPPSSPISMPRRTVISRRDSIGSVPSAFVQCLSAYVRNGVLWFLIGCLTTSCVVLAYILGALFLYRLYAYRDRHSTRWLRTLFSGPGFRKVIAPITEDMPAPPPPYEEAMMAGGRSNRNSNDDDDGNDERRKRNDDDENNNNSGANGNATTTIVDVGTGGPRPFNV